LEQAIPILADLGYRGVAVTLDHHALDPFSLHLGSQLPRVRRLVNRLGLRTVLETGGRYLLHPWIKHHPALVSVDAAERQFRIEFLKRTIDIAAALESDCVSFWSGALPSGGIDRDAINGRIQQALDQLIPYAERRQVKLALEPEPGMWIESSKDAIRWVRRYAPSVLGITLDIGHLHCLNEPIGEAFSRCGDRLRNVHIEDMRRGVHEHLLFGEGDIDFPSVLAALRQIGYDGGVFVELSRHSHVFPQVAVRALEFLRCHDVH
jgi:sugar phosphate isomerase/epimerase